ncbi:hypothetical protein AB0H34_06120 [Saccharopolyspora shandongensis]|uniref:hypothetical protein n=1 Tax=Saccharopolyspora shandongensis TaxID=418495 RepID=UPI0033FA5D5A
MPSYEILWCTEAQQERVTLPAEIRTALEKFVEGLKRNPKQGTYNKYYDRYTAEFDYGLVHYAVVDHVLKVIMFRIVGVY